MNILAHLKPWRRSIATALGVSTLGSFFEALALVAVAPLAQTVASGRERFVGTLGPIDVDTPVMALSLLGLGAVVMSVGVNLMGEVLRARAVAAWGKTIRRRLVAAFLGADWPTQARDRAGRLQEVAGTDVVRGSHGLQAVISAGRAALALVILLVGALVIDPRAAGAISLSATLLFAGLRPLVLAGRRSAKVAADAHLAVGLDVAETVTAARDIRIFGAAQHVLARLTQQLEGHRAAERRALAFAGATPTLYQGAGLLIIVSLLLVSSTLRDVDVASLGAVALLLLRSFSFGQQLVTSYQRMHESDVYLSRIAGTLEHYTTRIERAGAHGLEAVGEVRLEQVSYSYDGELPALDNVDVTLRRGEIVGITGPSGSGKSTLAQLLLRLRSPDSGRVLVDGVPIEKFDPRSWSRIVALVPQDVQLIRGTVWENISFFRDYVTEDDVVRAARAAGIHETVMALAHGYDTLIDRSERPLSGGQVQRIGVARALAANPLLIVLDEPTSALDLSAEEVIHDTITHARSTAVIVVIAHRPSTLEVCDTVLSIADGRIVSQRSVEGVAATRGANGKLA